jgi:hypothetical protein
MHIIKSTPKIQAEHFGLFIYFHFQDLAQQVLLLVPLWDAGSWPLYNGREEKLP